MAILDEALGFIPKSKPKFYQNFKVSATLASKIYKNAPVTVTAGYLVPAAVTGQVTGIALEHMDVTPGEIVDVAVCIDPDQIYEVNGDAKGDITDIGKYCAIKTVAGSNDHSTATVDVTNATATVTADTPFLIVDFVSRKVTDAAASANLKVLVKLVEPEFDKGFPAS